MTIEIGQTTIDVLVEDMGDEDCAFWQLETDFAGRKFYANGSDVNRAAERLKIKIMDWLTSQCAALARIEIDEKVFESGSE